MAKTVRRLWPFSWADGEAAAEYLAKQAEKGLILKGLINHLGKTNLGIIAVYEKTQPQKRTYWVDIFTIKTEEDIYAYQQEVSDKGWSFVAGVPGMGIYVSEEGENPEPLESDWREQYRCIRRSLRSSDIPFGLGTVLLLLVFLKVEADSGVGAFLKGLLSVEMIPFWFLALFGISCLVRSIGFYIRSERAMKENRPIEPRSMESAFLWGSIHQWLCILPVLMLFAAVIYFAVGRKVFGGETLTILSVLCFICIVAVSMMMRKKGKGACPVLEKVQAVLLVVLLILLAVNCIK